MRCHPRPAPPCLEFIHGLGVLATGPDAPAPVRDLCALTDAAAVTTVRARFAAAGRRCIAEAELTRLSTELRAR